MSEQATLVGHHGTGKIMSSETSIKRRKEHLIKNDNPIKTLSSRIDWQSPYYRIRRDEIRLPDGSDGVYNVVELAPSVFIVPVTADNQIVLIRNYRHTLQQWVWEVPAGGIKAGQSPDDSAREELQEEIGGTSDKLHFLMKASTMNGIGTNYAHFYLAHDVELSQPEHEKTEIMIGEQNNAICHIALQDAVKHNKVVSKQLVDAQENILALTAQVQC